MMAPTPFVFRVSTPSTVSSSCPSSAVSYFLTPTPTAAASATPVWTTCLSSTGIGLPDAYGAPSGVLLEEHTRVAWVASWSRMIPVSSDERFLGLDQLGRLASPHQAIVFQALIKIILFIRHTHLAMTSVRAAPRRTDGDDDPSLLRSKAVSAYQGLKSLMNISDTVIAPHPDNLFALLRTFDHFSDMFSFAEAEFFRCVEGLFMEDYNCFAARFDHIVGVLSSTVRSTLESLKAWTSSHAHQQIPLGGGIHDITKYVTMHIKFLSEHGVLLNSALSVSSNDTGEPCSGATVPESPASLIMADLLSHLEKTLETISESYQFPGLQWFFLMNNVNFILQEKMVSVKFGDDWILKQKSKLATYISRYLVVSWAPALSCLRTESRIILGCFKQPPISGFNTKFETTYAVQKAWQIEDPSLRKSMRGAVIENVLPTYRSFLEKHQEKHTEFIEYTPNELEELLSELFEG